MDDNEKFIAKWKPIHEKSIVKYVILYSLSQLLITFLISIFFLWIYPSIRINRNQPISEENITFFISYVVLVYLISIVTRLITWFSGEKRYRKLINNQ